MALFKQVKKPVLKASGNTGTEISPQRPRYVPKEAPCAHRCPNGNEIREILVGIAQAKEYGHTTDQAFELAWRRIAANNPFPAVAGRICSHGCENGCNRKGKDGAVAINAIERFIGDFGIARKLKLGPPNHEVRSERIAVLGAGAAGLSCAYQLALEGYPVTVFEAFSRPGGVFRYGVPQSRLPGEVLDAEIDRILELGVELKCDCAVGWDIPDEQVQAEYRSVFPSVGAQRSVSLKIPGHDAPNVLSGTAFLNLMNRGQRSELGATAAVIGGDLMAVDAARLCQRLGARATIVYRGGEAAIEPAALTAGVRIEYYATPVSIRLTDGKAVGLVCRRSKPGEPDSEFEVEVATVIDCPSLEPQYYAPEVLRSGKGHQAAEDIASRLGNGHPQKAAAAVMITADKMKLDWYPASPRHDAPQESAALTEDEVLEEAKRCMSCGMCMDCETCWMYCTNNCFVKLPKGEHYKIKLEVCNGCRKCVEACPCGFIEMI